VQDDIHDEIVKGDDEKWSPPFPVLTSQLFEFAARDEGNKILHE